MKIKSKGFGMLGIILTLAIILILVFGFINLNGQSPKNQIEQGNADIEAAKKAAAQENQDSLNLQEQVQESQPDLSPNTYHNIENSARNLPK